MRNLACCFLLGAAFLNAQTFSFGAKVGGLFTDPAGHLDESRPFIVGPSAEIGFGSRVGVEVNALYHRFGSATSSWTGNAVRGNSFEFPVLGKYYFSDRDTPVRPFASAGFSVRNVWLDERRSDDRFGRVVNNTTDPAIGAVFGGGVGFKIGFLKFAPELRYTRFGGANYPATNPNQVQGLLGISF